MKTREEKDREMAEAYANQYYSPEETVEFKVCADCYNTGMLVERKRGDILIKKLLEFCLCNLLSEGRKCAMCNLIANWEASDE